MWSECILLYTPKYSRKVDYIKLHVLTRIIKKKSKRVIRNKDNNIYKTS